MPSRAHLLCCCILVASSLLAPARADEAVPAGDRIMALLEQSRLERRGVTLFSQGAQIQGVVTALDRNYATLRSQTFGQIAVRLDRIDAVAGF